MRNKSTRVRFPVFNNHEVRVIVSRDIKRTGYRLGIDLADCRAAFVSDPEKCRRSWLVLGDLRDAGTVAHESSHAVRHMLKESGVRLDDETFAYHLDYLVRRIHKFLEGRADVDV